VRIGLLVSALTFVRPGELRQMEWSEVDLDAAEWRISEEKTAFSCGIRDFEDAVQAMCARRTGVDYIVTHNLKDFKGSPVQAISSADALVFL
jgi:integrase